MYISCKHESTLSLWLSTYISIKHAALSKNFLLLTTTCNDTHFPVGLCMWYHYIFAEIMIKHCIYTQEN